jgi:WD40 repeat protein
VLPFDRVLVAPSADELTHALGEAAAAADRGRRSRLVAWPPEDLGDFLDAWRRDPEGVREWRGEGRSRSASFSAVGVAWWSDLLGRRHCRFVARRPPIGRLRMDVLGLRLPRPALALVYPELTFLREEAGGQRLLAACRCGASGGPATLGWMGDRCAACHDRQERGEPTAGAAAPARLALSLPERLTRELMFDAEGWLRRLFFTPDGATLIAQPARLDVVPCWGLAKGNFWATKVGSGRWRPVTALALSPDGGTLALGHETGGLFWGGPDGLPEGPVLQTDECLTALAFSPDGARLAASCRNATLLFDRSGRLHRSTPCRRPYAGGAQTVAFTADGRLLAAGWGDGDAAVSLYDAVSGEERARLPAPHPSVKAVAVAPDGTALAAAFYRTMWAGELRLWRLPGCEQVLSWPHPVSGLAFSPDGRLLAAGCHDGRLGLWGADGASRGLFVWHAAPVGAVTFSPDGRWLATGDAAGQVRLWPVSALLGEAAR